MSGNRRQATGISSVAQKHRFFVGAWRLKAGACSGFTLIELLIVLGIIVLISIILLVSNQRFNSSILLRNLAYQIGLSLREAQLYGVAVRDAHLQAVCPPVFGGTSIFCSSYGMYINTANTRSYSLFADANNNQIYDNGTDAMIKTYSTQYGFQISNVCVSGTPAAGVTPVNCAAACPALFLSPKYTCTSGGLSALHIAFKRPNPDAFIHINSNAAIRYTNAYIEVMAPGGARRSLSISQIGQIVINGK